MPDYDWSVAHISVFFSGQRVNQFHSMKEIADLIANNVLSVDDFNKYQENLCCEWYPDQTKHEKDLPLIEQQWPRFDERDDCDKQSVPQWGLHRMGRIPKFILNDDSPDYKSSPSMSEAMSEGREYCQKFDELK